MSARPITGCGSPKTPRPAPTRPGPAPPRSRPRPPLDARGLVVLGGALAPGQRAGLDLARVHSDRQVRHEGVLGLAGAVGDDGAVTRALGQLDGFERLGEGADLVELDQDRVGDALADALLED